jgi:hypothetical protein
MRVNYRSGRTPSLGLLASLKSILLEEEIAALGDFPPLDGECSVSRFDHAIFRGGHEQYYGHCTPVASWKMAANGPVEEEAPRRLSLPSRISETKHRPELRDIPPLGLLATLVMGVLSGGGAGCLPSCYGHLHYSGSRPSARAREGQLDAALLHSENFAKNRHKTARARADLWRFESAVAQAPQTLKGTRVYYFHQLPEARGL